MVMDSSGKFNFNLSTVLPLSLLTLSSSPDFQQVYSIQWSEFNDDAEQWRRSAQQTTLAYCSPLQTQIINSSIHATTFRRGLRTSLWPVAASLPLLPILTTIWNHPLLSFRPRLSLMRYLDLRIHFSTCRIKQDSSYQNYHQNFNSPFSFDGKSKRQKMW